MTKYRKVSGADMAKAVQLAMAGVMSVRYDKAFEVKSIVQRRPGLAQVILEWPAEVWWVCLSLRLAIEHAEAVIRDRLRSPGDFDGEWLLRFVPGDFHEHLEASPTEADKHRRIKDLGFDLEAAAKDYRAGFRDVKWWIEGVWDAHSFSFRGEDSVVCWRVR